MLINAEAISSYYHGRVKSYVFVAHQCNNELTRRENKRLAKWFTTLSPKDKAKIIKDVSQLVLSRRTRMCNFLEYKGN